MALWQPWFDGGCHAGSSCFNDLCCVFFAHVVRKNTSTWQYLQKLYIKSYCYCSSSTKIDLQIAGQKVPSLTHSHYCQGEFAEIWVCHFLFFSVWTAIHFLPIIYKKLPYPSKHLLLCFESKVRPKFFTPTGFPKQHHTLIVWLLFVIFNIQYLMNGALVICFVVFVIVFVIFFLLSSLPSLSSSLFLLSSSSLPLSLLDYIAYGGKYSGAFSFSSENLNNSRVCRVFASEEFAECSS